MMKITKPEKPRPVAADADEALDAAARGTAPTSDDAAPFAEQGNEVDRDEIDLTGDAAGLRSRDARPLADDDPIARRDAHRWELDPASAEDAGTREP